MKNIWSWVKNNPNRTMFLIPIILVAGISISHVVAWYDIANPISWAIYLSIAIEVGAMTALVAAMNKIKGGVWFMFGLVTFIQMIGNIFFSFKEVDPNSDLFKAWIELTGPVWESIGSDINDVTSMKRWLAFLEGGLLPIISLTSLHFFIKYDDGKNSKIEITNSENTKNPDNTIEPEIETFEKNKVEDKISSENNIVSDTEEKKIRTHEEENNNLSNNKNFEDKLRQKQNLENEVLKQKLLNENKIIENQINSSNTNDWRNVEYNSPVDKVSNINQTISESESNKNILTESEKVESIDDEVKSEPKNESDFNNISESPSESQLIVEENSEKIPQLSSESIVETTPEFKSELEANDNNFETKLTVEDNLVSEEEKKFEIEQFELTSESEIVDIPIDVNFDSSNTIGKKLSYKRTS